MKASDFDIEFDSGEDLTASLDLSNARRPNLEKTRIDMDFPAWMVHSIDKEAHRLGVSRQDLIKFWVAERLR